MREELEVLKMFDTNTDVAIQFRDSMMSKSGQVSLLMGCSMYDTSKQIVCSAVLNNRPQITDEEIRKEIFLRFYGRESSRSDREKFLSTLMEK